jgi:hypothetical protein
MKIVMLIDAERAERGSAASNYLGVGILLQASIEDSIGDLKSREW